MGIKFIRIANGYQHIRAIRRIGNPITAILRLGCPVPFISRINKTKHRLKRIRGASGRGRRRTAVKPVISFAFVKAYQALGGIINGGVIAKNCIIRIAYANLHNHISRASITRAYIGFTITEDSLSGGFIRLFPMASYIMHIIWAGRGNLFRPFQPIRSIIRTRRA